MKKSKLDGRSGRKVLLVEDADELRELYEIALVDDGYEVKTAAVAEEALEIALAWRPDLVLTDVFMPGMGGLELVTRVRSDLTPPVPPIVVISGFPDAKAEALRRGAMRFETKPLSLDELVHVVQEVFDASGPSRGRDPNVLAERRAATRAIGEATLTRYLTEVPEALERLTSHTRAAARFFDCDAALAFLLRGGTLTLVASSSPSFQLGVGATEILPLLNDVVESNGALVLACGASRWQGRQASATIESLVAVPYLLDQTTIGAFCIVDSAPHEFSSAWLGMLEYLARRVVGVPRGGLRVLDDSGLLERSAFGAMLTGSARHALDAGSALGFAVLETAELPRDGSCRSLFDNLPAPGLMIGVIDRSHVAIFASADSPDVVRKRLVLARGEIASRVAVIATAELTFEDPVPRADAETFILRGQEVLGRAIAMRATQPPFLAIDARRR